MLLCQNVIHTGIIRSGEEAVLQSVLLALSSTQQLQLLARAQNPPAVLTRPHTQAEEKKSGRKDEVMVLPFFTYSVHKRSP